MQKDVTGFRIFIHKKQTEKIKILYRKLANIMGYSNLSLTQKPGLTTFYEYACEMSYNSYSLFTTIAVCIVQINVNDDAILSTYYRILYNITRLH